MTYTANMLRYELEIDPDDHYRIRVLCSNGPDMMISLTHAMTTGGVDKNGFPEVNANVSFGVVPFKWPRSKELPVRDE